MTNEDNLQRLNECYAAMESFATLLTRMNARLVALEAANNKPKRKRAKPNRSDYDAVLGFGDDVKATEIEAETGIPASTVRRYRKMPATEVNALPPGEPRSGATHSKESDSEQ